ncbi:MAG TPA: hypothetical protein VKK31_16205 [Thermoanaerobaculia bacterium]|nr:hypothetical protein [Thermoanaerobaculia bacterium]
MIQDPSAIAPYPRGDVRAGSSAVTRFVERRLAPRYGWNLEVFQGREAVFPGSRTGGFYRVLNPAWYFVRPSAAISTLQVAEWLRFGNSVSQLTNVFALAERYGIRSIRLPSRHLFYQGAGTGDVTLDWDGERRASDFALSGYFLHMRALMPPLDAGTERSIIDRCVRPLLARDVLHSDPRVGADDLVMHFRGGDAFDTEDIKPGYWQPPLAYYLAVFEHDCPKRVWLVFEDRRNPTIAGIEEALRLRGVEVIVQSGTLLDDLRVLLSARRLVASIGTFVPAVALLSSKLETFYQFSRHPHAVLALKGIRVVCAYDAKGEFMATVASRWGARSEDLAMMMSYPTDCIRIE